MIQNANIELNKIYNCTCLELLQNMPDKSIDCCITSPPYWGLRNYGTDNQIGCEYELKDYINNLIAVFNQVFRVLNDKGTCFVNLQDKFYNYSAPDILPNNNNKYNKFYPKKINLNGKRTKCLALMPEQFALEMINNNWILRNKIIWHKPNQKPESVKDRFTVDYEIVYFFTKSKIYNFNQILEQSRYNMDIAPFRKKRSVWSINTKSSFGHPASFPEALIEPMILSGSNKGGVILDPFMGSGTTAVVAVKNQRNFLGSETNKSYVDLAYNRLKSIQVKLL